MERAFMLLILPPAVPDICGKTSITRRGNAIAGRNARVLGDRGAPPTSIEGLGPFARCWCSEAGCSEAGCSEALALVLALEVRIDDLETLLSQLLIAVPDL